MKLLINNFFISPSVVHIVGLCMYVLVTDIFILNVIIMLVR